MVICITRLIDADALYKETKEYCEKYKITNWTSDDVLEWIVGAPTVDAEPVRHGHNENREYHEADEFRCSECGLHLEDWTRYVYDEDSNEEYVQEYVFKRCPECGARIVGE